MDEAQKPTSHVYLFSATQNVKTFKSNVQCKIEVAHFPSMYIHFCAYVVECAVWCGVNTLCVLKYVNLAIVNFKTFQVFSNEYI